MTLTILIGIPASGKSYYASNLNFNGLILSSDSIRKELYGDEMDQTHNQEVFDELYSRLHEALKDGTDVIIDATSVNRRERHQAIKIGQKFGAYIEAIVFKTPIATCIKRNDIRDRKVPDYVYDRYIQKFENPMIDEGFDCIRVIKS